jgi:hypothetical protein
VLRILELAESLEVAASEIVERLGQKQLISKEQMQNPDIDFDNFPTVVEKDGLFVLSAMALQEASAWQNALDDDRQERMDKIFGPFLYLSIFLG